MSFSTDIKKELVKRLVIIGFKKNKMIYTQKINEEAWATIVFTSRFSKDKNTRLGHYYIGLDIGVSFSAVNKLYQKLTESDTLFFDNVVHKQIGYLMPIKQYKEWVFIEGENTAIVFNDMFKNIKEFAFPYYKQMSDLNVVFDVLVSGEGVLHIVRDHYLPILYYLKGDKQSGLAVIEKALERQIQPEKTEIPNVSGATVELYVGPDYGKADPTYLTFAENYKKLPETNQLR